MIVLDTNVVSELMRPSPAVQVVEWVSRQAAPTLYLTTISEAELRYGVAILPAGRRRDGLLAGVEGMLREDFAGRIIPFDRGGARLRRDSIRPPGLRASHQPRRLPDRGHSPLHWGSGRDQGRRGL